MHVQGPLADPRDHQLRSHHHSYQRRLHRIQRPVSEAHGQHPCLAPRPPPPPPFFAEICCCICAVVSSAGSVKCGTCRCMRSVKHADVLPATFDPHHTADSVVNLDLLDTQGPGQEVTVCRWVGARGRAESERWPREEHGASRNVRESRSRRGKKPRGEMYTEPSAKEC